MAFASISLGATPAAVSGRGLRADYEDIEIHNFTKLTGDTTGTVTPTVIKFVRAVYIYFIDGTASVTGVATLTNTIGSVSIALTVLETGANTLSGCVIIRGGK